MDKEQETKLFSKIDIIADMLATIIKEQRETKHIFSKYDEQYLTEMEKEGPVIEG